MNEDGATAGDSLLLGLDVSSDRNKGGFKTLPFIIGNLLLVGLAHTATLANISLYMVNEYHLEVTTTSNILFFRSSVASLFTLAGALIADSFLGRFSTIGFGSIICCLGMALVWLTAILPEARPPQCDTQSGIICSQPTVWQFIFFLASLGLFEIGSCGIDSSTLTFGANQLQMGESEMRPAVKQKYFSCYYAATSIAALVSTTCVVYIQDHFGWGIGFGACALLILCGVVLFYTASPLYFKPKCKPDLLSGFYQVVVACYRNWDLKLPDEMECNWYRKDENRLLCPSKRLKFLNKACVIRDAERDLTADGEAKNPWKLCTVQQVEDLKSLLRVIPIWSTGVIFNVISAQPTFPVLQAQSMNRQITRNFSIPAGSFGIFTIVSIISWILVYNRVVLPLASKFKGAPVHINAKTRIGVGLFFSFLAMAVTSLVESIRRSIAIKEGLAEFPKATVPMSALWLIPQNALVGFAEASFLTSQVEFYYSEIPKSISSIVWGLSTLSGCFGSLLASVVLSTVDKATREVGSWVSSNINKGHYDDYYLVLGGISMGNFIYFLACSYAYGPMQEEEHMKETSEY